MFLLRSDTFLFDLNFSLLKTFDFFPRINKDSVNLFAYNSLNLKTFQFAWN